MNQPSIMEEQESPQQDTEVFLQRIASLATPEEKLQQSISFMREALAQAEVPNFKGFWEVRKQCLPLFKEQMQLVIRSQLWAEYIELTREGRRLKDLLDAETAFAVEQIDLAIKATEEEVAAYQESPENVLTKKGTAELPRESQILEKKYSYYDLLQRKISLLNLFAIRINALRKELIKTDMRIRQKNGFFQRLSHLGDIVFPARKELIQEISDAFVQDINRFVEENFSPDEFSAEKIRRSVFFFRDEIKALQAIAKILTLNTYAFSSTREKLSHCWDQLKGMEKELKKEYAQQKQKSAENFEKIQERIQALKDAIANNQIGVDEALEEIDGISRWMRDVELTRNDVLALKDALKQTRQPLDALREEKEQSRKQKDIEFEKARRDRLELLKGNIQKLTDRMSQETHETLAAELEECRRILSTLSVTKSERQHLERSLKTIRDCITNKQEQAVLSLPDDERATLDNLKGILEQRKQRRQAIQNQMEEYRKIIGGSSLDIENAFRYQELMNEEKQRLNEVNEGISEIEKKIRELRKKA